MFSGSGLGGGWSWVVADMSGSELRFKDMPWVRRRRCQRAERGGKGCRYLGGGDLWDYTHINS